MKMKIHTKQICKVKGCKNEVYTKGECHYHRYKAYQKAYQKEYHRKLIADAIAYRKLKGSVI